MNVSMVVSCITYDALSDITDDAIAIYATRSENSLACPSRKPNSFEVSGVSDILVNAFAKTNGLMIIKNVARTMLGRSTCFNSRKSNCVPIEKKNRMRKNSLNGFNLSDITRATGDMAREHPATKAPIS